MCECDCGGHHGHQGGPGYHHGHHSWSRGWSQGCKSGPGHCGPCFPDREEEVRQLELCLDGLRRNAAAVEERLSLLKKAD